MNRTLIGFIAGVALAFAALAGGTYFLLSWRFVDNYQHGYEFDATTGRISPLARTGWNHKTPWLQQIYVIDGRPMQVCINANQRVLNCKLVRFNSAGLELFLSWHGRGDYGQAALNDILKSYAYDGSGRTYPFLTILRELRNEEAPGGDPSASPVTQ